MEYKCLQEVSIITNFAYSHPKDRLKNLCELKSVWKILKMLKNPTLSIFDTFPHEENSYIQKLIENSYIQKSIDCCYEPLFSTKFKFWQRKFSFDLHFTCKHMPLLKLKSQILNFSVSYFHTKYIKKNINL